MKIVRVILATKCDKHGVPVGVPCFHIKSSTRFGYYAGICNDRAVRAGMVGRISRSSLMQKKSKSSKEE